MPTLLDSWPALLAQTDVALGGTHLSWLYAGFIGLVLVLLAIDLGVFNRTPHVVKPKEALAWTCVWAGCALAFSAFVYFAYNGHWLGLGLNVPVVGKPGITETMRGPAALEQFLAGYVVEWSLSVDNLFVIAVIFKFFAVPAAQQHRVLFWGILGALIMRGAMIALGAVLLAKVSWITYVFGGFLILTAVKMAFAGDEHVHPDRNIVVRLVRRFIPVSTTYDGSHFVTRIPISPASPAAGLCRAVTPLFLALVVVEFTDVIFAVDSVPAIFAITGDPFIVLTSNVFAIMGLRSLYFLLAGMLGKFKFLKHALVLILGFVGVKMLLVHSSYKIDTTISLGVILTLLAAGVGASLLWQRAHPDPAAPDKPHG